MNDKGAVLIGKYGVVPPIKKEDGQWHVETTVITPGGGTSYAGMAIGLVHVSTWLVAFVLAAVATHRDFDKSKVDAQGEGDLVTTIPSGEPGSGDYHFSPERRETQVALGFTYCILAVIVAALLHAATAVPSEKLWAPLVSMVLMFAVGLANVFGLLYVSFLIDHNVKAELYDMVAAAEVLVVLGSSMIVAFYVKWSKEGACARNRRGSSSSKIRPVLLPLLLTLTVRVVCPPLAWRRQPGVDDEVSSMIAPGADDEVLQKRFKRCP